MGCGSSSQPQKKYGSDAAPAAASDAPAKETTAAAPAPVSEKEKGGAEAPPGAAAAQPSAIKEKSNSSAAETALEVKRRPSLSREVEEIANKHEGHALMKDAPTEQESKGEQRRERPSTVQTKMELWWMEEIPAMYGVADSDELREELQEDGQADIVKKCVSSKIEDIPQILKEWMHDCPDAAKLQSCIDKVCAEVNMIQNASKPKVVTFNAGASDPKRGMQRKGTGFVTAGQVRTLMAQDFGSSSEEESDENQDDEEFERQMQENLDKQANKERIAVASEHQEIDPDWKPPVYEKTPAQKARIGDAVSDSFMFAALNQEQLLPLLDAFEEVKVEPGTKVIEEGAEVGSTDRGLYVFESGELDVYKIGRDGAVFTYTEMGQYFGELALLYNAPRSATVVATKPSVLWSIDRTTFNMLVKNEVREAKERRVNFLKSVELLKSLKDDEVATLGDALRERTYGCGVHIIEEGTEGDVFFILEKGTCAAIKDGNRVMEYNPADYFGELALLKDAPRAADIITLEDSTVLSLDRKAFQRLLGPLDDIMKGRMEQYGAGGSRQVTDAPAES